jgi:iron complex outermembrane receptor protein
MKKLALLCASSALVMPGMALAQSTGSIEFEEEAIVVTGARTTAVGGVEAPDTSKTREVLTSEFIQRQTPGQSINETINNLPGVSFQNNDPFGSAGGTLTIRGFDNSRISETFDGIPLNDTGNYALFSNQLLDPEIIEQVNVSLGSTDVDSPTASATGSTVNFRTRLPYRDFAVRLQGSYGDFDGGDFQRIFGSIDTGSFTPWGTRAFGSASMATNDFVYGHRGVIYKQQYNGRLYQPIGSHGDFISISGHYNQNRNNFGGSAPLRQDLVQCQIVPGPPLQTPAQLATCAAPRTVGSATNQRFPLNEDQRDFTVPRCLTNQVARSSRSASTRPIPAISAWARVSRSPTASSSPSIPASNMLRPMAAAPWSARRAFATSIRLEARRRRISASQPFRQRTRAARPAISAARPISAATSTATATGSTRSACLPPARPKPTATA